MKLIVLSTLAAVVLLFSCNYNNLEDDYTICISPPPTSSFSAHVLPLLQNNCMPCHTTENETAGFVWDNYNSAAANADILECVLIHDNACSDMPKNAAQLSDCEIQTIINWVDDGAENN